MATATPVPMLDSSRERFSRSSSPVADALQQKEEAALPKQSRSSSLSDIEDRADEDTARSERGLPTTESDQIDTEAETERLEDSQQKSRKTQKLLLTAANSVHQLGRDTPTPPGPSMPNHRPYAILKLTFLAEIAVSDTVLPGSDAASPSISSVEDDEPHFAAHSPRKRKRSEIEHQELDDQRRLRDARFGSSVSPNNLVSGHSTDPVSQPGKSKARHEATDREDEESEEETQGDQTTTTLKRKILKRGNRKTSHDDTQMRSSSGSMNGVSEPMKNAGAPDSNGDDLDVDDTGERAGFESPAKDDESSKSA